MIYYTKKTTPTELVRTHIWVCQTKLVQYLHDNGKIPDKELKGIPFDNFRDWWVVSPWLELSLKFYNEIVIWGPVSGDLYGLGSWWGVQQDAPAYIKDHPVMKKIIKHPFTPMPAYTFSDEKTKKLFI